MPAIIGIIIFIAVLWAIGMAIGYAFVALVFVSANVLAAGDKFLGSWAIVPPYISWAAVGFGVGTLTYFAIREADKLSRPVIKPFLISISCAIIVLTPILGPMTLNKNTAAFQSNDFLAITSNLSGEWKGEMNFRESSLELTQRGNNLSGTITYNDVKESLTGEIANGAHIILRGTGYTRLKGSGSFSLDTFYGTVSDNGKTIRGDYKDTANHSGNWFVTKVRDVSATNTSSNGTVVTPVSPLPFEDHGACPFECCTYREWTAKEDVEILQDMKESSPVVFQVQKDEKVTGETGVVITTKPGTAKLVKPARIDNVQIAQDSVVNVLSSTGEGFFKVWYRGKVVSLQEGTDFQMINKPETVWWVKIKNSSGQSGWSKQPEKFDNKDACG